MRPKSQKCLVGLNNEMLDGPVVDLFNTFNRLPHCFTLQSCYGHFLHPGHNDDPCNLEPLPITDTPAEVEYRIAYVALCVENSDSGKMLLNGLKEIPLIDPENIQFCCAEWFWERQDNSYVLQVEPDRFKRQDSAILNYTEALKIEKARDLFFARLKEFLTRQ
jgi:hypothetical protein